MAERIKSAHRAIRRARLRETYIRHKGFDALIQGSKTLAKYCFDLADNISESVFVTECMIDSMEILPQLSEVSRQMTEAAALSAVEDILDTLKDSLHDAGFISRTVANPLVHTPVDISDITSMGTYPECQKNSSCNLETSFSSWPAVPESRLQNGNIDASSTDHPRRHVLSAV